MVQDEQRDLQLVRHCLDKIGVQSPVAGCEVLAGGISQSHTYRVQLGEEAAVLKVTLADSAPYVLNRARREYAFYRSLAQRVPLRVPSLLGSYAADDFGACVLLAAYRQAAPPQAWAEGDFLQVAEELAHFHALHWGRTEELDIYGWLRPPRPPAEVSHLQGARNQWCEVLGQERLQGNVPEGAVQALYEAIERVPETDATLEPFPRTLCHGDCHIGNLLRDEEGNLVWADWQEVGIARGPEDLSFLLQRAFPAGETRFAEAAITRYQARLEAETGEPVRLDAVRRAMDGYELRARLLEWPYYLEGAPAEWVLGMLRRIELLAGRV